MGVRYADERVDAQRVAPNGVVTHIGFRRRHNDIVVESLLLTALTEVVVAVHVVQAIDAIRAGSNAFDNEMSAIVGASVAQHGLGGERRILQIGIKPYLNPFHRLQALGIQHIAANLHRVDMIACGKRIGVVPQRVVLIVVGDGIAEVNGVSGVLFQRVEQMDEYPFARALDFRHLQLWRRHDDILRGVVHFNVLIKVDGHALALHTSGLVLRSGTNNAGRLFVVPSTIGLPHAGTGDNKEDDGSSD